MDFSIGLIVGLLVGLLLHWVVESVFNSDRSAGGEKQFSPEALSGIIQRLERLEASITAGSSKTASQTITQILVKDRDDLSKIKGIGPVFAARLNEAGIYTFEQIAETAPSRLRQVSAAEEWQVIDVGNWITQARHLADSSARKPR